MGGGDGSHLEHAAEEDALGRQQRQRAAGEREAKCWRCKEGDRACACPIRPVLTCRDDRLDEVEVLVLLMRRRLRGQEVGGQASLSGQPGRRAEGKTLGHAQSLPKRRLLPACLLLLRPRSWSLRRRRRLRGGRGNAVGRATDELIQRASDDASDRPRKSLRPTAGRSTDVDRHAPPRACFGRQCELARS